MFKLSSWVWSITVRNLGAQTVIEASKKTGLTDLLVLVKSITGKIDTNALKQLLEESRHDIKVHAWIVCFNDQLHENPLPHNKEYREYLLNLIRSILENYDVDGVHLDYIRYNNNAYDKWIHVSSFVREVRKLLDDLKPGITLSIASKAEGYNSKEELKERALYYGQNYEDLAQYVDVFMPMTYYLDYNVEPLRAVIAAQWVKELTDKPVVMGVQLHPGEHTETKNRVPETSEIALQVREAKRRGLDGVCFFRFEYLYKRLEEISRILKDLTS